VVRGMRGHIAALANNRNSMSGGKVADKLLIFIRFRAPQLVVKVDQPEHNPDLIAKIEQQAKQRNRIRATGNRHSNAITRVKQFMLANVREHALRQLMHGSMLQPRAALRWFDPPRPTGIHPAGIHPTRPIIHLNLAHNLCVRLLVTNVIVRGWRDIAPQIAKRRFFSYVRGSPPISRHATRFPDPNHSRPGTNGIT